MYLTNTALGAGNDVWSSGNIIGGGTSQLNVQSAELDITGRGGNLGTTLFIEQLGQNGSFGVTQLSGMTANLNLNGTANYIDVGNGGFLNLNQQITVAGQQNTVGGISLSTRPTRGSLPSRWKRAETWSAAGSPLPECPTRCSSRAACTTWEDS
jgi:hypothetical protein